MAPVRLALAWSIGTYLLFVFGPWAYPMRYSISLFGLVVLYNLAMYRGFSRGVGGPVKPLRPAAPKRVFNTDQLITFAFLITLILFPIRLVVATQNYALDPTLFLAKVQVGLDSAQQNYSERYVESPPGIWSVLNYVYVALGFIPWLYVPLVIMFWERVSFWKKALCVAAVAGAILAALARGQNFGAFEAVVQVAAFMLVRRAGAALPNREPRLRSRGLLRGLVPPVILVFFLLSFFANTMKSRIGDQYRSLLTIQGGSVPLDELGLSWSLTPPFLQPFFASIAMYVSHGYAALSMATEESFSSTFGLGSSFFLLDNLSIVDPELVNRTFQAKLEASQGYSSHVLWHTAYLWIANDVSLLGVPFVLYGLFMLFGRAWREYVDRGNVFGALMMAPMTVFVVFVSANNQLTGQPNALFGIIVLVIGWLLVRRRYSWTIHSAESAGDALRLRATRRG